METLVACVKLCVGLVLEVTSPLRAFSGRMLTCVRGGKRRGVCQVDASASFFLVLKQAQHGELPGHGSRTFVLTQIVLGLFDRSF